MTRIPQRLRETIARNIRAWRKKKYPGRGGAKLCAEDFGVSQQQWSPWERGLRTPDELRLQQIADFFGTTVELLRRDTNIPGAPIFDPDYLFDDGRLALGTTSPDTSDDQAAADVYTAAAYHHALSRLLNQVNKADIKTTVNFLKSLADLLERDNGA